MRLALEVLVRRGPIAESRHVVHAALVAPDGRLAAGTSEPDRVTTFRSSAKPFQLLPLVERGHADRWGWSDEDLAVMSASHTGSAYHVERVRAILARLGLEERHLGCGFHEPADPESRARLRSGAAAPSPLYNNCSGKHSGMLCLALSEQWPIEGYFEESHPVQRLARASVATVAGLPESALAAGVDACGVCTFGLPLTAMARAYARLATAGLPGRPPGATGLGVATEAALRRIREAMRSHPMAVGGVGSLSTALMEAGNAADAGREARGLVAKGGAEGLECVGIPDRGLGLAVKCEDGGQRAMAPAVVALLEHLGVLAPSGALAELVRPIVKTHVGREVGVIETTVRTLEPAAS